MGFLSKVWKGLKKVVGAVAMIAAPFIAAPIAGLFGVSGTIGTALVGAGIGGLGAAAAGVNPLIGAAIGGLGSFAAGGTAAAGRAGGMGSLFAGPAPGSTASVLGTTGAAAAPAAGLTTAAAGGAAAGGLSLGKLALYGPLAMAIFGKAPQNLTQQELESLQANAEIGATERGVFNQRLEGARSLLQQGEARPEQAFAEAQLAAQRGLRETERGSALAGRAGLQDTERRRASIEGARIGSAAVTGEQARAAQTKAAGLSALPTSVPTSANELDKKIYEDLYQRRADYSRDLAAGFGNIAGNA